MHMFVFETVIAWLFFIFLATLVYFILLRGRLRYLIILALVTIGVLANASFRYYKGTQKTERVAKLVKDAFIESSSLEVSVQVFSENSSYEKVIFQTPKKEDLLEIAELFSPDISLKQSYCECSGDMRFDLYKEDRLHLSFTYHHQRHIRIKDSDFGDINLTPESIEKLKKWQGEIGITN